MANTNTRARKAASASSPTSKKQAHTNSEEIKNTTTSTEAKTQIIPKDIDPNQYVVVRNGFQGKLVYVSPRSGEVFTWDSFGDEQEIELKELKNAKSSCKKMFENNWFMFDEENDWVIDYLGVRQFYKSELNIDNFDSVFSLSTDEMKETINTMSVGLKKSVAYRARQLILEGAIDSRKAIATLEEVLNTELVER